MNINYAAADKENTDPCQQKGRGLSGENNNSNNNTTNKCSNTSPLSPGAAKRKRGQAELKDERPPLRDITALSGLTPTFAQPAFDIASDAQQPDQNEPIRNGNGNATGTASLARKKKSAVSKGKVGEEYSGKKAPSSLAKKNGGTGGGSSSSGLGGSSFLRPLR